MRLLHVAKLTIVYTSFQYHCMYSTFVNVHLQPNGLHLHETFLNTFYPRVIAFGYFNSLNMTQKEKP